MKSFLFVAILSVLPYSLIAAPTSSEVVQSFMQAYNKHDVVGMMSHTNEDLTWMHITGKKIVIETSTKAEFGAAMTDYFESLEGVNATIVKMIESGSYVSTVEKVTWDNDGEELSQCSIGTFRVKTGKIAEFWYFPAHACDELNLSPEPEVGVLKQTQY
ncbi:nuclear transport factor 2 family protein [Shewanella sp. VB17]|uniref:nuclear transport factor 2 family protein n=1 Tax=Shewanella sp. VB17 TaxID=2739432 RepID=UPI001564BC0A|nr:nuclear transport factor 2 family protein [Shewanella sp. VB17]NRD75864.1 nuclear transport factor 2 family protein [Shewanella sp. VB17]